MEDFVIKVGLNFLAASNVARDCLKNDFKLCYIGVLMI